MGLVECARGLTTRLRYSLCLICDGCCVSSGWLPRRRLSGLSDYLLLARTAIVFGLALPVRPFNLRGIRALSTPPPSALICPLPRYPVRSSMIAGDDVSSLETHKYPSVVWRQAWCFCGSRQRSREITTRSCHSQPSLLCFPPEISSRRLFRCGRRWWSLSHPRQSETH